MYAKYKREKGEVVNDTDYDGIFKKLINSHECHSLAKKYCTADVAKKYQLKKTKLGGTLAHCVKPGAQFPHLHIGAYACDPEAYEVFRDVFDNVVRDYHGIPQGVPISHPEPYFGDLDNLPFGDLDPENKYIISTRVRVGRSIEGIPFPPLINLEQVKDCEKQLVAALKTFTGDLAGTYHSLENMDDKTKQQLIDDHFLFGDPPNKILVGAGVEKDWPKGRGIFHNKNKTFLAWINEEDHIRIISMQKGGNVGEVYKRLVTAINHIEKTVKFAHDPRLGYLTFCPSNLGTTCRASVHIKIPRLTKLENFEQIVSKLGLQLRGTAGEHTESVGGVWDVSNKRRLGYTELDALKEMATGVKVLILIEKSLEEMGKNGPSTTVEPSPEYNAVFKKLFDADKCNSLAKKYCTPDVAKKYERTQTKLGGTLAHCVKPGAEFPHLHIGVYACDPEAYEVFRDVFDNVVRDYHGIPQGVPINHPEPYFGDIDNLPFADLDPENKYIISTRVRVGRSIEGIPFPPLINLEQVKNCEKQLVAALKTFSGDLAGTYHSLEDMDDKTKQQLIDDHFLFGDPPNKILVGAGVEKDWPKGRGIFHNKNKTFLAWINEEDHIRIISMQKGGNVAEVYKRLVTAINHIEKTVKFAHDPRLGYLTFCPSNLGTTCRASVHIKIPLLTKLENFEQMVSKLGLQLRGTAGEHTESVGGVWDVSNKRRLGYTELDALKEMTTGVKVLLLIENSLEQMAASQGQTEVKA